MRLNDLGDFSHPILADDRDDYSSGRFAVDIKYVEDKRARLLGLECEVHLSEPGLEQLILDGKAVCGLWIQCADTYFNEFWKLSVGKASVAFQEGDLFGLVRVRPLIVALQSLDVGNISALNEEYMAAVFNMPPGSILGIAPLVEFYVDPAVLENIDSIFSYTVGEIEDGKFTLQLDGEKIVIVLSKGILETFSQLRAFDATSPILTNSIYLPALMQVITYLQGQDTAQYEGKRWNRVLRAKCQRLGIDIRKCDILPTAQTLLNNPFQELVAAAPELL
jgi:hypothetical protein